MWKVLKGLKVIVPMFFYHRNAQVAFVIKPKVKITILLK